MPIEQGPTPEPPTVISNYTDRSTTLDTSSKTVVPANVLRKVVTFVNDSPVEIYLAFSTPAVIGKGIRLNRSGGAYQIDKLNLIRGTITAIAASGAGRNLTIVEGV